MAKIENGLQAGTLSAEEAKIKIDRINKEVFVSSLKKLYDMTPEERGNLGELGRQHVEKNYNFETFNNNWINYMLKVHEESGSWETRKNYQAWECIEL